MHLLLLVPYYEPDLGPSAPLFALLAKELVRRGHQVNVVAAVPHYPSGEVPDVYQKKLIQRTLENGVQIVRVWLPSINRVKLSQRLLQYICYQLGATWVGRNLFYDAVFVANPALWVWLPFLRLVVIRHKPAIFSVQDVYPDVGVTLGIFRHKPIVRAVASLERFCLNRAVIVQIISDAFKPRLIALGVPDTKMVHIYNWVDTTLIRPLPRVNAFAREHNLVDRFVVLYAGNLGLSQGLEHVLGAAELLAKYPDLRFVFVGDGSGREFLLERTKKLNLDNIQFIPFQPRDRLPEVLASADISLVVLRKGIGSESLPSKTFSILASGRPVLASVDPGSETWRLVERAGAGLCVPSEEPAALAEAILTLKRDQGLRERLGQNGRIWAERYHSPQAAAIQFEKLFMEIVDKHNTATSPVITR